MKYHNYTIHGLSVDSAIELPGFPDSSGVASEVKIRYGEVPKHLPNSQSTGVLFEATPGDYLLHLPSICSYRVEKGTKITLMPHKNGSTEEIRLFLQGSVLGALFHQRGDLPLHGSAVSQGDKAFCILGSSTSGKSTLATSLSLNGYSFLSDDTTIISFNNEDEPVTFPGNKHVKLWKDVIEELLPDIHTQRVRSGIEKYYVPINEGTGIISPIPVSKILILNTNNQKNFSLEEIHGARKFTELRNHIYRERLIKGLGVEERHFKSIGLLANNCEVIKLARPLRPLLIQELTDFLLSSNVLS